jgi:hypothetical protein
LPRVIESRSRDARRVGARISTRHRPNAIVTVGHSFALIRSPSRRASCATRVPRRHCSRREPLAATSGAFGALMGDRAVRCRPRETVPTTISDHACNKIEDFIPEDEPRVIARATRRLAASATPATTDELRVSEGSRRPLSDAFFAHDPGATFGGWGRAHQWWTTPLRVPRE